MDEPLTSFPTKTGRCDVYADRLEFSRADRAGLGLPRHLFGYGLLAAGLGYLAYNAWQRQVYGFTFFFGLLALLFLLGLVSLQLTTSTALRIARATILRLTYHPARPGATRACFVVLFCSGRRLHKRHILLPDPPGNEAAAAQALAALRAAGLTVAPPAPR